MGIGTFANNMSTLYNYQLSENQIDDFDGREMQRVREYIDALSLYEGRQLDILKRDVFNQFRAQEAEQLVKCALTFNITKRIVDKLAMLYKEEPSFTCDSNPILPELLYGCNGSLKQADRVSELLGLCWIFPKWNPADGVITLVAIPPDQIDTEYNQYDPSKLEKVTYISKITENGTVKTLKTVWTDTTFFIYKGKKDITDVVLAEMGLPPNPDRVNPYNVIPYVPFYSRTPLYGDTFGQFREDLITAQRTINLKLTDLMFLIKMQAGAQLVIEGTPDGNIALGTGTPLVLPAEMNGKSSAYFLSPGAKITEVWNSIREIIHYLAFIHALGGNWTEGGSVPSGEALKVVNADLEEYREDKEDTHRKALRKLAAVAAVIAHKDGNQGNGQAKDFAVEFGGADIYTDPLIDIQAWEGYIRNGIKTRADWYQEQYPDATEADAQAAISANIAAEKAAARVSSAAPVTAADFMTTAMDNTKAGK